MKKLYIINGQPIEEKRALRVLKGIKGRYEVTKIDQSETETKYFITIKH